MVSLNPKYTNPANPVRNFCKQKLRPLPVLIWTSEALNLAFARLAASKKAEFRDWLFLGWLSNAEKTPNLYKH